MQILDGKKVSEKILNSIKQKTLNLPKKPGLTVVLANDSYASKLYVSKKVMISNDLGFESEVYRFRETSSQDEIIDFIKKLNNDDKVNGILVQLPLFEHLDESAVLEAIDPKKDVDGFHPVNVGKLFSGLNPYAVPCTPKGIIRLLKEYSIELSGKNVVIIGRSNIVGKPMAALFLKENATVTIAHSKTKNLSELLRNADIIVSATGKAKLVQKDMVKEGAVVIDVGITRDNGKLTGDVDFDNVKDVAGAITPVPGGVGPMTIAMLIENTLELFLNANKE